MSETPDDDPLADVDVELEEDPFDRLDSGDVDDPFDRVEDDVDEDPVRAELSADEEPAGTDGDGVENSSPGPAPELEAAADEEETIVRKRQYCERCEHLSEPPELSCGNPGTEIRELVDMEHFRVYDCPVVEERRSLGHEE